MTPFAFSQAPPTQWREHFAITGYNGSTLSVVVGFDPSAVDQWGSPQTWQLCRVHCVAGAVTPARVSAPSRFRSLGHGVRTHRRWLDPVPGLLTAAAVAA